MHSRLFGGQAADVNLAGTGMLEQIGCDFTGDEGDCGGGLFPESFGFRGGYGHAAHFCDAGRILYRDNYWQHVQPFHRVIVTRVPSPGREWI